MEYQALPLESRLLEKIECLPTLTSKCQRNRLLEDLKKIACKIKILRTNYEESEKARIKAEATVIRYINEENLRKNGYERIHKYKDDTSKLVM